jgi:hypothetical protein
MGFDLRYNFINTFRTVDAWRNNILLNAQGGLLPGFKQRRTHLGLQQSSFEIDPGSAGTASIGGRAPMGMTAGELTIQRTALQHRQDPLKSADGNMANLGIQGNGFFAVAESLNPGARVMLTRDGSFSWKLMGEDANGNPRYQLVNSQGLYVLRAGDVETDETSPNFMKVKRLPPAGSVDGNGTPLGEGLTGPPGMLGYRDGILDGANDPRANPLKGIPTYVTGSDGKETLAIPPDGNVSQLAIVRVPNQADLNISSFGPTVYGFSLNTLSGSTVKTLASVYTEVRNSAMEASKDFPVVGNRIEQVDAQVALQLSILENQTADFVFKNLSTMLQEYNNSQDQLLNLIR